MPQMSSLTRTLRVRDSLSRQTPRKAQWETMGLLWRLVSPFVSTFNAAPTVKIHDPVLGVANRLLQAIVRCGIAVMLYTDPPLYTEAPNAKAKFFASSGTLAELRRRRRRLRRRAPVRPRGTSTARVRGGGASACSANTGRTCANFDYAELNVKGETEMIFPDDRQGPRGGAGRGVGRVQGLAAARRPRCGTPARNSHARRIENSVYGARPPPGALQAHEQLLGEGAEGMAMVVQHSYTASTKIPEAYREGTNKDVPTYIHRHGDNLDAPGARRSRTWATGSTGTARRRPASRRRNGATSKRTRPFGSRSGSGCGSRASRRSDDHNARRRQCAGPGGVTRLSHRTTGVLVKVTLYYVADHWMDPELHILLQSDDGWHSARLEVHYVDYPVARGPGRLRQRPLLRPLPAGREVRVRDEEGRLRVVEQNVIFLRITALLVFMAISGTLVTMIARRSRLQVQGLQGAHEGRREARGGRVGSCRQRGRRGGLLPRRAGRARGASARATSSASSCRRATSPGPRATANFLSRPTRRGRSIGMAAFANLLADGVPVAAAVRIARNLDTTGRRRPSVAPAPAGPISSSRAPTAPIATAPTRPTAGGRATAGGSTRRTTCGCAATAAAGACSTSTSPAVFYRVDGPSAKDKFRSAVKGIIRERRWRPLAFLWRRGKNVQVPGRHPRTGGATVDAAEARARTGSSLPVATLRPPGTEQRRRGRPPVVVQSWEATGAAVARPVPRRPALRAAWARRPASGVPAGAMATDAAGVRARVGGRSRRYGGRCGRRWKRGGADGCPAGRERRESCDRSPRRPLRRGGRRGQVRRRPGRARRPRGRGRRRSVGAGAGRAGGRRGRRRQRRRADGRPAGRECRELRSRALADPSGAAGDLYGAGAGRICSTTSTLASTTTTSTSTTTRAAFSRGSRTWCRAGSSSSADSERKTLHQ